MYCEIYLKRIIPFFLTFLLAVWVANLFSIFTMPLELLENQVAPPVLEKSNPLPEEKNSDRSEKKLKCMPADPNLKYQRLSEKEFVFPVKIDEESEELKEKTTKELRAELEKLVKELEEIKKSEREFRKSFSGTTNLLYIEKCYEIK